MLPDRVSNPGPLTYESGALPIALRGPAKIFTEMLLEYSVTNHIKFMKIAYLAACHDNQMGKNLENNVQMSSFQKLQGQ